MKIKLDYWAITPTRAHDTDAGLDLYAPDDFFIKPGSRWFINTGVHVQLRYKSRIYQKQVGASQKQRNHNGRSD